MPTSSANILGPSSSSTTAIRRGSPFRVADAGWVAIMLYRTPRPLASAHVEALAPQTAQVSLGGKCQVVHTVQRGMSSLFWSCASQNNRRLRAAPACDVRVGTEGPTGNNVPCRIRRPLQNKARQGASQGGATQPTNPQEPDASNPTRPAARAANLYAHGSEGRLLTNVSFATIQSSSPGARMKGAKMRKAIPAP